MKKLLIALMPLAACAVEIDGIAAKVGAETILKSDVLIEMRRTNADPSHYADMVRDMVERKLILKAAGESKMTMQEWVVESRVREVVQRNFGGDRNKLMEALARDKVSYPEWYQRLREDMIVGAMRYQIVDKNVTASPADLRREFKEHPDRYASGAKVTVSVVLLKPEDRGKRAEIDAALTNGTSFADLARRHSADSHAAEGGVWRDVVPDDTFSPAVCDAIAKTPKGQVSKWIEADGWSYLLYKNDETVGKAMTFEEAFDKLEENVKEATAKRLYDAWLERLRKETYVKIY